MGDLEDPLVAGHEPRADEHLDQLLVVQVRGDQTARDLGTHCLTTDAGGDQPQHQVAQLAPLVGLDLSVELFGRLGDGSMDPAGGVVAVDGEGVAFASLPRLEQGVGQERQGTGVAADLPDQELHQARLDDQSGLVSGALDGIAQAVLVQGTHEMQALLDQSAEAGVLRRIGEAVAPHGHQYRPAPRLVGQAFEERAPLLQVFAQGEDLLCLIDGEHGVGWRVLRERRQRLRWMGPGSDQDDTAATTAER